MDRGRVSIGTPPRPCGAPAPSALRPEWEGSERVLEQARAEHAQAERELAQLQRSIYQTALALKRMKEQADLWDRALVTNRAALLIVADRMRDLQRRAEAPASVTPLVRPHAGTPGKGGRPAAAAPTGSVFKLVADGNQFLREGKLEKAHAAFSEALRRDPTLLSAQLGLAFCAYQQDRLADARALVRDVLNANPNQPQAISLRGLLSLAGGPPVLRPEGYRVRRRAAIGGCPAAKISWHGSALEPAHRGSLGRDAGGRAPESAGWRNLDEHCHHACPQRAAATGGVALVFRRALALGQPPEPNLDALFNSVKDAL